MLSATYVKAAVIAALSLSLVGPVGISPANAVASPAAVNLGSATSFAVLAANYVTTGAPSTFNGNIAAGGAVTTGASNTIVGSMYSGEATTVGASSAINGNLYSGAAITLGAGSTSRSQYFSVAPQYLDATNLYSSAMSSMNTAITDINNRTATSISGTLDGVTLTPGAYSSVASLGLAGVLTLDAQGDPNAVFIIKSDSYLVTAASSAVVLANQAQAKNIFWVPKGYFTAGADSIFKGNVLATTYVSIGARTAIEGRLFSKSSYVIFGIGSTDSVFGITGIGATEITTSGTVPSVLGLSHSAAGTSLNSSGFTLGTVTTTASGATSSNHGKVVTQSATGASQLYATAVDLVLYAYVAPPTSGTVPSVLGLTHSTAGTSLNSSGFTLGTVTTTASGATSSNHGKVVTQSATGASQLYATPVDLVLYAYVAPPTSGTVPSVLTVSAPEVVTPKAQIDNTVYFSSLKATLNKKSKDLLLSMIKTMKSQSNSIMTITITGSVSETKSSKNDRYLATKRAKAVRELLRKFAPEAQFVLLISKSKSSMAKFRNATVSMKFDGS
jgi:outer membrane protein OmpA-like peptidoglycan-associated protein